MPRRSRCQTGGYVFHVLNRRAGRQTLFAQESDYLAFLKVFDEAQSSTAMRVLAYALMPTHWHLLLWPRWDDELSEFMQWLTVTHTRRWHAAHGTEGTGPVYQGRFKSFPVQDDDHFYTVCRYVERNPLRAALIQQAQRWRWTSLWQRHNQRCDVQLSAWPLPEPADWCEYVNRMESEAELTAIRAGNRTGTPFGNAEWVEQTATRLGLKPIARRPGRPSRPF